MSEYLTPAEQARRDRARAMFTTTRNACQRLAGLLIDAGNVAGVVALIFALENMRGGNPALYGHAWSAATFMFGVMGGSLAVHVVAWLLRFGAEDGA